MMESKVETGGVSVAVWEAGSGHPLLVLHGLGLDHIGISEGLEESFDEESPWRRIYLDLPGMGATAGPDHLASADALLEVVVDVVSAKIGEDRFAILGQSYGGYLALGALQRLGERISGLALLIPVIEPSFEERVLPRPLKLRSDDEAMATLPDEFLDGIRDLIVDESGDLAAALRRSWIPSIETADEEFIERLQADAYSFSSLQPGHGSFAGPSLVLCGRHDALVGYQQAMGLLPHLERGTFAVLDGAGHLAQLEKPALTSALIADWLRRVEAAESLREPVPSSQGSDRGG